MSKITKRYKDEIKDIDFDKCYSIEEAVDLLKKISECKFDETVELAVSLNIDPKKTDQIVRGTVVLPYGTGKELRVIAFCNDKDISAAKEAGAIEAGGESLIKKIEQGWLDFDSAVASPDMMKEISKLGRFLGPRGLMPNPKAGTLTDDIVKAISELKKGKIEFKVDSGSNIHVMVGKLSFEKEKLTENIKAVVEALKAAKPKVLKKEFIKKMVLTSTMGPGIKIEH